MARITKESLEAKIKKAVERVIRTGKVYNAACDELKELRNKMAAIENETLVEAFMKSSKTLDEVVSFLESDMKSEEEKAKPVKRRGRRKRVSK